MVNAVYIIFCLLTSRLPETITRWLCWRISWCLTLREVTQQLGWVWFQLSFPSVC